MARRDDGELHFHNFDDENHVVLLYFVARRDIDFPDRARCRRIDGKRTLGQFVFGHRRRTQVFGNVIGLAVEAPLFALGLERDFLRGFESVDRSRVVAQKRVIIAQLESFMFDFQLKTTGAKIVAHRV